MTKTLITRISKLDQYDVVNRTVLWEDSTESRWGNVYGKLQVNDNAIFIATDKLLVGTVSQFNSGQSIQCSNIQEVSCSNDQLLQLHEIYPELISRVKANFQPFIHPQQVNIGQLIADANAKRFVSYYILSGIDKYKQSESLFKVNDRIIVINANNQLDNVKLHSVTGLINFPDKADVNISVEGLNLNEILDKNKSIKRKSTKSNNVTRIQNIIKAISESGIYKFNTFFSYYDGLLNKLVYGKRGDSDNKTIKISLAKENVYKVSMGINEISEEIFTYCNDRNLIIVHKETKAKGTANQTQADTFAKQMKVGDYFYMCRGNRNIEVVGRIVGDTEECEYQNLGAEGWLQRSYEEVADAKKENPYQGEKKWWTPNDNSTCIAIPKHEIDEANNKIFIPFFKIEFEYEDIPLIRSNTSGYMDKTLNQILYGPPGTGKTYNTINKALEIIGESTQGKTRQQIKDLFDAKMKEGQIVFTTFHQSMSYEDFIEGIKPIEPKEEGQPVNYKVQDGIFKKLCQSASPFRVKEMIGSYEVVSYSSEVLTLKKPNGSYVPFSIPLLNKLLAYLKEKSIDVNDFEGIIKAEDVDKVRYPELEIYLINGYSNVIPNILKRLNTYQSSEHNKVLIIDEINRGNVSQIFGELITLIEEDKRMGKEEALEATLPYSKAKFGVPPNLYIIGTMNTADRSVEALDAALRRRFSFEEMPPKPALIATEGKLKAKNGVLGTIDLPDVLNTINKRIEKLIDKDHQIGHSYFMTVTNLDELKTTFQNKIIPLLQEYFFGDYGKIGLVLGQGFFETAEITKENLFADFDDYDASDFSERTIYKIKELSSMPEDDFNKAINTLLKK